MHQVKLKESLSGEVTSFSYKKMYNVLLVCEGQYLDPFQNLHKLKITLLRRSHPHPVHLTKLHFLRTLF